VYSYGSLDFSPTVIDRRFGMTWGVGGFLLTVALGRLGGGAVARMRARIVAEGKTTFASSFARTIGLSGGLDPELLGAFARHSTGAKHLIGPTRGPLNAGRARLVELTGSSRFRTSTRTFSDRAA
jgi:NADPH:quinone reductase